MYTVLTTLGTLCSIYSFLVFLRIILSWFETGPQGRPYDILCRITDPWLNAFRLRFLRFGAFDFSPLVAIAVLSFINAVIWQIADYRRISLGILVSILLGGIWSIVSFFLILFAVICVLRWISMTVAKGSHSLFWQVVDRLADPVIYRINRALFRRRIVNYKVPIIIAIVLFVGSDITLSFLVSLLRGILEASPL